MVSVCLVPCTPSVVRIAPAGRRGYAFGMRVTLREPHKRPVFERVTFSVPAEVLVSLDNQLTLPGESRSATVRRLIEEALQRCHEEEESQRFIRAYEEQPQTEEEFGYTDAVSLASFAELPWRNREAR